MDVDIRTDVEDLKFSAGFSAETEALVIDFVPGADSANSLNWVVSDLAAALSVLEDFIDSAADHTVALAVHSEAFRADTGSFDGVESGISFALSADSIDSEEEFGAGTLCLDDIVNFVGRAGDTADEETDIIEGIGRALLTNSIDFMIARLTDTESVGFIGIDIGAGTGRVGKLSWGSGGVGIRDTDA